MSLMDLMNFIPQPGLPWGSYSPERNQWAWVGGTGSPSMGSWFPAWMTMNKNRILFMTTIATMVAGAANQAHQPKWIWTVVDGGDYCWCERDLVLDSTSECFQTKKHCRRIVLCPTMSFLYSSSGNAYDDGHTRVLLKGCVFLLFCWNDAYAYSNVSRGPSRIAS